MPTTFRPYQPDQGLLLAPDLRDWLPEGHLAHQPSSPSDLAIAAEHRRACDRTLRRRFGG